MNVKSDPVESAPSIEGVILDLCAHAPRGRSVDPTEAAQVFARHRGEGELAWRDHLAEVRRAAVRLAIAGRLVIYRKGKVADPLDFRGVYRFGAPSAE